MSVTLTGPGGVFTRAGRWFGGLADLVALMGGPPTPRVLAGASWVTRGGQVETDAAASPSVWEQIDGHWTDIANWQNSQNSLFGSANKYLAREIIRQVDLDAVLSQKDLPTALSELIRQMTQSGDAIQQSTVALGAQTPGTPAPAGNPVIVGSIKDAFGRALQTPFAETVRFQVTGDAYLGSATARGEPLSVLGGSPVGYGAYNWPAGSGGSRSVNLVDAQRDNAGPGANCLANGDFETFSTTDYPDNWLAASGAPGVDFGSAGAPGAYTQASGLKLLGGTTAPALTQQFSKAMNAAVGAGGTPYALKPYTQYAVNLWVKGGDVLAAGVLALSLTDALGAVLKDYSLANNTVSKTLSGVGTSWVNVNGTFRTPGNVPAGSRLWLGLTTPLAAGKVLYVDDLAMAEMTPFYDGGPSFSAFAGSAQVAVPDRWTMAISNTCGLVALWMERLFGLRSIRVAGQPPLMFPYSATPSVPDSVVQ